MKITGIIWSLVVMITAWAGIVWSSGVKSNIVGKINKECLLGISNMSENIINKDYSCYVTEGVPLPVEWSRGDHVAGIVEGSVVVAGGNNWSKDKTTKYWLNNSAFFQDNKWISGPLLSKPLAYAMYAHDESGLYIAGGTNDGTSVIKDAFYLNSLKEGKGWESLPQLPEAIGYGAGAILNGKFYVSCGTIGTEKTNRMWVLDIETTGSKWRVCQPIPSVGRMFPALVACGKYLYLLGGLAETSPLTPLQDVYQYNPEYNQWEKLKDLPMMGYAWVSQPVDDSHLLVTGRADGKVHTGIWIIDLRDMSAKEIGNLIIPSTTAPLINIVDKQWWLIGGEPDANKNRTNRVSVIILK